jgi:putative membrane protein
MPLIDKTQKDRISAAITSAEARTSGEIVAVIAPESASYLSVPFMIAALLALLVPWPFIHFTWMTVQSIYLIQLAVFAALVLALLPRPIRFRLVPRSILDTRAHRRAVEQFMSHNLDTTVGRTGVLIYVSVAERYAEIIADDGLSGKVAKGAWQSIVEDMTESIGAGEPETGLTRAIERVGAILAEHAPGDGASPRRLPDHLVVLE